MIQDTTQSVLFPGLFPKPVLASFDQPDSSSDGRAIFLKAIDSDLDLTERLARCIRESREEGKIIHPLLDLLRQRVYGMACGYPDCNDAGCLADDPIQKLLLDRDPIDGNSLGSQPTLSRFENAPSSKDLLKVRSELAEIVIEHHADDRSRQRVHAGDAPTSSRNRSCGGAGIHTERTNVEGTSKRGFGLELLKNGHHNDRVAVRSWIVGQYGANIFRRNSVKQKKREKEPIETLEKPLAFPKFL